MLKWMVSQANFGGGGGEPVDQRQSLPGGRGGGGALPQPGDWD